MSEGLLELREDLNGREEEATEDADEGGVPSESRIPSSFSTGGPGSRTS